MSAAQPLAGRVAIVTGASSGLGARFATVLADAGSHVVASGRRLERLEELAGPNPSIHPVRSDVGEADDRAELVATTLNRFGRIDVCVNNAGISSGGPERQATVEAFREVMRVNVEAVFAEECGAVHGGSIRPSQLSRIAALPISRGSQRNPEPGEALNTADRYAPPRRCRR